MHTVDDGDQTDCYPGISGLGPKKAEKLIKQVHQDFTEMNELGPLSQLIEERTLALYAKHRLTSEYAISRPRLAKILRYANYPHGVIHLWEPPAWVFAQVGD